MISQGSGLAVSQLHVRIPSDSGKSKQPPGPIPVGVHLSQLLGLFAQVSSWLHLILQQY